MYTYKDIDVSCILITFNVYYDVGFISCIIIKAIMHTIREVLKLMKYLEFRLDGTKINWENEASR